MEYKILIGVDFYFLIKLLLVMNDMSGIPLILCEVHVMTHIISFLLLPLQGEQRKSGISRKAESSNPPRRRLSA